MARDLITNLKFKKVKDADGFDPIAFGEMYEKALLGESKTTAFTQKKTFSPSSVGYGNGNCPRYWFIAFKGAEFEYGTDSMGMANMSNGSHVHDRIQAIIAKTPAFKANEVEIINEDPPIRGFADTIIEWNGKDVVLEIKSAKDEIFALRQAEMAGLPYHKVQLLNYMKIKGLDQGAFIYENKNDQTMLIIPLNMDEKNTKLIDGVWDWMREVRKAYEDDTIPERTFTKSTWACKACPVFNTCWNELKNEKGEIRIEPLVLVK